MPTRRTKRGARAHAAVRRRTTSSSAGRASPGWRWRASWPAPAPACWSSTATRSASARPRPAASRPGGCGPWASRARTARRSPGWSSTRRTRTARFELPWTFSTFDYPELCGLLWEQSDAEFETAKVNGRTGDDRPHRPRRPDGARCRRRARLAAGARAAATSRPTRRSRAGSRCTPGAPATSSRSGSTAATCRPATAGASPPATSCAIGVGSFDPRFHVKDTTVLLAEDLERDAGPLPGQLDPAQAARGDRGRHLLRRRLGRPLPAADRRGHPHRALLRHRLRARAARGGRGAHARARQALRRYGDFSAAHEWKFEWMLRAQRLVPRVPPRLLRAGLRRDAAQALRRLVVRPLPARSRRPSSRRAGPPALAA